MASVQLTSGLEHSPLQPASWRPLLLHFRFATVWSDDRKKYLHKYLHVSDTYREDKVKELHHHAYASEML